MRLKIFSGPAFLALPNLELLGSGKVLPELSLEKFPVSNLSIRQWLAAPFFDGHLFSLAFFKLS